MAHLRKRYLQKNLEKMLAFSPIVGVLGHRQVGKTTLIQRVAHSYVSMDFPENRKKSIENPSEFIGSLKKFPAALDECQVSPEVFPTLKELIRKNKKPGQYILSGSVRFTSRKAIQESLTGRIVNLELLPFTVSELIEDQINRTILSLHQEPFAAHQPAIKEIFLEKKKFGKQYLTHGGLPGVCFIRNEVQLHKRIEAHLETILNRDLQLLLKTTLRPAQLNALIKEVALQQGSPIHYRKISISSEANIVTVKRILTALESLFMIRVLTAEGGTKSHFVYLEDLAESNHLAPKVNTINATTLLCFSHAKATFQYLGVKPHRFYHFHTRNGVQIPVCVEYDEKNTGFFPIKDKKPSRQQIIQARSYLSQTINSKIVFLTQEMHTEVINEKMIVVPIWDLL